MKQIIYRSQPFGFDDSVLAGILVRARANNLRDDITGALLCRHDLYLQLIEGPATMIDALFARISRDDRHSDIQLLLTGIVGERMFPQWSMLDDQMPSLAWSQAEVRAGAIEAAGPEAARAVFARIAGNALANASSPV